MNDYINLREEDIFQKTVTSFKFYRKQMLDRASKSILYYETLPNSHKKLIPDFMDNMNKIMECIETNAKVIELFAKYKDGSEIFSRDENDYEPINGNRPTTNSNCFSNGLKKLLISSNDMDKVRSTLKQFVRDWSSEGALERQLCYQPVIDEIVNLFQSSQIKSRKDFRVLIPGAGLGRLAWEIARLGFTCQGNEWSLYMLLPAYYILNNCSEANILKIHPWLSSYCNNSARDNQLAAVTFPDVNPTDIPVGSNFSMAAGDFVEIYTEPANWECVATVFFIDTAHNILSYIDTIWKILKPGGFWINLGPLLYHYADVPNEDSIELSYDEVKNAIRLKGFEFLVKKYPVEVSYTQDRNSMLSYQYKCAYFVVQKPGFLANETVTTSRGDVLI